MSTTIRIRGRDKALLDRLQARLLLKTGKRVALDVVLGRMLEVAAQHEDEVIADRPLKLSPADRRRILALPRDFGVETSPDTIDDELYGKRSA
jgi:hypothetical protein